MLSSQKLEHFLNNKRFLVGLVVLTLGYYLWPLFSSPLYVETFDNLDSTVVWMELLAKSGEIFSSNNTIIPNMMNGLPRSTYGSEFNILFWLYYFFPAETAFRINSFLIHVVAFISMYIFLNAYINTDKKQHNFLATISALMYAILPFWAGAGLSSALLPLYSYILLNILYRKENWYEWLILLILPFYSSFIFLYMFYIVFAGIFWVSISIKNHKIEWRLFYALSVMSIMFLLVNYRLVEAQFTDNGFISHRSVFNIYFNVSFMDAYTHAVKFFLDGWMEHQRTLMMPALLPLVLIAMLLVLFKHTLNASRSIILLLLITTSYVANIWEILLINRYMMPILFVFILILLWFRPQQKKFILLIALALLLSIYRGLCFYEGLSWLQEVFPILTMLNISRAAFIIPFVWYVIVFFTFLIYVQHIRYANLLIIIILFYQLYYSVQVRRFDTYHKFKTTTFESYYAPKLFSKITEDIPELIKERKRIINYGIEPSVALFNGLYTVDGYSVNYPLSYKESFRMTQETCLNNFMGSKKLYDIWGGKVYLLCVEVRPENYHIYKDRNITEMHFNADIPGICSLGTDYLLSAHKIKDTNSTNINFIKEYHSNDSMWDIYLYKINCKK